MVSAPPKAAKPAHVLLTRAAWIGFSGAILAAVITIFPDLRPSGLDRLLERLADLTAAINGEVITIGPGGGIAHAETEVHIGDRLTIKNGDDVPHTIVVPGAPLETPAAARPPDPTVDSGAVEPPTGPASPVPPQEPAVKPEQPEPPPEPAADPRPQVCDGLQFKAGCP